MYFLLLLLFSEILFPLASNNISLILLFLKFKAISVMFSNMQLTMPEERCQKSEQTKVKAFVFHIMVCLICHQRFTGNFYFPLHLLGTMFCTKVLHQLSLCPVSVLSFACSCSFMLAVHNWLLELSGTLLFTSVGTKLF